MVAFLCLLFFAVVLILQYFMAKWFFEAAEAKGYHNRKYFHIAFWLGLWGCLLIIALPDRGDGQNAAEELPEL